MNNITRQANISIFLSLLLVMLGSCSKPVDDIDSLLRHAESCLAQYPDSADAILHNISFDTYNNATPHQQGVYWLLLAKSADLMSNTDYRSYCIHFAINSFEDDKPTPRFIEALLFASYICQSTDDLKSAVSNALYARQIAKEIDNYSLQAECSERLASIYEQIFHFDKARSYLIEANIDYKMMDDNEGSRRVFEKFEQISDSSFLSKVVPTDSLAIASLLDTESLFYNQETTKIQLREQEKYYRLRLFTSISIALIIIGIIIYAYHIQRKNALLNRQLSDIIMLSNKINSLTAFISTQEKKIGELSSDLTATQTQKRELNTKIHELLQTQFKHLNSIISEYARQKDSKDSYIAFYKNIEYELNKIRQPKNLAEIESLVNECSNDIISRLRQQLPQLNNKDMTFITLTIAGLNAHAIGLFLGMHPNSTYKKRKQLFTIISNSDAPDHDEFIDIFQGA